MTPDDYIKWEPDPEEFDIDINDIVVGPPEEWY